jgi:outer membrane protein assembly factor BamB
MRWFALFLLFAHIVSANVLSQWRGPNRDGRYPATELLKEWPENGPRKVWQVEGLGKGHTSAAVTKDNIYITGMHGSSGVLFAFDHAGNLQFKKVYGKEWKRSYNGTRSTPLVVDDLIYLESGHGVVYCLKSNDGAVVWSLDLIKKFGTRNITWGMSEQLLVDGDRLYCTPGGVNAGMVALDRFSGRIIWKSPGNGELSAYCSPILVRHNSVNMLITMLAKSVIGVNADTGELLWRRSCVAPYDIHANTPIYHSGNVYVQSGEGGSGMVLKIAPDGKSAKVVWQNKNMDTLTGHAVLFDGFIYGAGYPKKGFQALNWKTGISFFEYDYYTRSNVVYADNRLYIYSEKGIVALVKPNSEKFDLISYFKLDFGSGPHWAHPVIHNGRLYIRHGDVLAAFDIDASK